MRRGGAIDGEYECCCCVWLFLLLLFLLLLLVLCGLYEESRRNGGWWCVDCQRQWARHDSGQRIQIGQVHPIW